MRLYDRAFWAEHGFPLHRPTHVKQRDWDWFCRDWEGASLDALAEAAGLKASTVRDRINWANTVARAEFRRLRAKRMRHCPACGGSGRLPLDEPVRHTSSETP